MIYTILTLHFVPPYPLYCLIVIEFAFQALDASPECRKGDTLRRWPEEKVVSNHLTRGLRYPQRRRKPGPTVVACGNKQAALEMTPRGKGTWIRMGEAYDTPKTHSRRIGPKRQQVG